MKKRLTTLLFLIIVAMSTKVFAADTSSVTLNAPASVKKGDTVTVNVNITSADVASNGLQGTLKYDSNVLEFVKKVDVKSDWGFTAYNPSTGIFLIEVKQISNLDTYIKNSSANVGAFVFKVKKNTTASKTTVEVSDMVIGGSSKLQSKTATKTIKITENKSSDSSTDKDKKSDKKSSKTKDKTTAKKSIPHTGLDSTILVMSAAISIAAGCFYFGFRKYRGI